MDGDSISLLIIIFCIIMSAFFSASETAFSCLNRIRIKTMAEKGDKKAKKVLAMSENYDSLISTILIGNNIVNILASSLAAVLFLNLLKDQETSTTVSTAVITVVVLIFGEVTPKTIAKENPEKFAMFASPLLRFLQVILTPVNFLFAQWKKLMSMIFKSDDSRSITEEELLTIVEEAEQEGELNEQEGTLIRSAIEFSEQEAIDVLTPRIDITGVSTEATKEEIAEIFAETGYSRLPLYNETIDHIVGIIYQKDFHNYVYHTDRTIDSIVRPALFTTQSKKIGELLKELQQKKLHIAVVLDEYGGTIGIVTLEDILEELVGEIWDEHDEVTQDIVKQNDSEYLVLGGTNIEELFETLEKEPDEEMEVQTVSGWVMEELDRVPEVGDSFEYQNLTVSVIAMDEKRVEKVRIIVREISEEEED